MSESKDYIQKTDFRLIFIFAVLFEDVCGNFTVYGGVGWGRNVSFYAVSQRVSWYSAAQRCEISFGGQLLKTGYHASLNAYDHLLESNEFNESYIWVGYVKSGYDENIYSVKTCPEDPGDITFYNHLPKTTGLTECVLWDISNPNTRHIYADCQEKHSYLCIVKGSQIQDGSFDNVTVDASSELLSKTDHSGESQNDCLKICTYNFNVIATLYHPHQNVCTAYRAIMDGSYNEQYEFNLKQTYTETSFYFTPLFISHMIVIISDTSGISDNLTSLDCDTDLLPNSATSTMESSADHECRTK